MKIVGKILWWDNKDQNGIIIDSHKNEFYFDISVINTKKEVSLRPGAVIQFTINTSIKNMNCAKNVTFPDAKEKIRFIREFEKNYQLSFDV